MHGQQNVKINRMYVNFEMRFFYIHCSVHHCREREVYSKDYKLYQRLTVQEKGSPDDELPESSKHVENE